MVPSDILRNLSTKTGSKRSKWKQQYFEVFVMEIIKGFIHAYNGTQLVSKYWLGLSDEALVLDQMEGPRPSVVPWTNPRPRCRSR